MSLAEVIVEYGEAARHIQFLIERNESRIYQLTKAQRDFEEAMRAFEEFCRTTRRDQDAVAA